MRRSDKVMEISRRTILAGSLRGGCDHKMVDKWVRAVGQSRRADRGEWLMLAWKGRGSDGSITRQEAPRYGPRATGCKGSIWARGARRVRPVAQI